MTFRGPSCTPARSKPQPAPVSSVLASLESEEFVPQSFVSHRAAKAGGNEVCAHKQGMTDREGEGEGVGGMVLMCRAHTTTSHECAVKSGLSL